MYNMKFTLCKYLFKDKFITLKSQQSLGTMDIINNCCIITYSNTNTILYEIDFKDYNYFVKCIDVRYIV